MNIYEFTDTELLYVTVVGVVVVYGIFVLAVFTKDGNETSKRR